MLCIASSHNVDIGFYFSGSVPPIILLWISFILRISLCPSTLLDILACLLDQIGDTIVPSTSCIYGSAIETVTAFESLVNSLEYTNQSGSQSERRTCTLH